MTTPKVYHFCWLKVPKPVRYHTYKLYIGTETQSRFNPLLHRNIYATGQSRLRQVYPNSEFLICTNLTSHAEPSYFHCTSLYLSALMWTTGVLSALSDTPVGSLDIDCIFGFVYIVHPMAERAAIPNVWTTSYGFNEPDLDINIALKVCDAYTAFTSLGTSTFMPSGNGGVAGNEGVACTTFIPTFPSTCPSVTSVGGPQVSLQSSRRNLCGRIL